MVLFNPSLGHAGIIFANLLILFILSIYGIWQDLAAWIILLRGVAVIGLQFWDLKKIYQIEKCEQFCQRQD